MGRSAARGAKTLPAASELAGQINRLISSSPALIRLPDKVRSPRAFAGRTDSERSRPVQAHQGDPKRAALLFFRPRLHGNFSGLDDLPVRMRSRVRGVVGVNDGITHHIGELKQAGGL